MQGLRNTYSLLFIFTISIALLAIRLAIPEASQAISLALFYIALGEALNIFTGLTLYVCFGYVAFVALGMYGSGSAIRYAITVLNLPLPAAITLGFIAAVFFALMLALIVGYIGLRLRGAYFAIATVGLSEGLRSLIEGTGLWGGSNGLIIAGDVISFYGHEAYTFISTDLADYLMFTVFLLSLIVMFLILNSRLGYGLAALREDEDVANVMGIDTTRYKLAAFLISAIIAGMIGASKMLKDMVIYPPQAFAISYTVEAIIIVMLGGIGTISGPIIGGLLYTILKYVLTVVSPGLQLLILGIALVIICILFPYGIIGWIKKRFKGTLIDKILI